MSDSTAGGFPPAAPHSADAAAIAIAHAIAATHRQVFI